MHEPDVNPTQGFKATRPQLDWPTHEGYWREHWKSRPYVVADRGYEYYEPGYRYGFERGLTNQDRQWQDVEGDLRSGWSSFDHRGHRTWDEVKDAVRDAWHRVRDR